MADRNTKVGELFPQIAVASNEQAEGIEQTNGSRVEMDIAVQQVASNAEASASAPEKMNAQAEQMRVIVRALASLDIERANDPPAEGNGPLTPTTLM
jgi:methyl-accepting chemotaxis protein